MNVQSVLATKWFHTALLFGLVAVSLYGADIHPMLGQFAALGPVVAWLLGLLYERAIILQAELVDREQLREVERGSGSMWS
jgi:hypothetical protein